MSSAHFLHRSFACLTYLIWMVNELSRKWQYSCCFIGHCFWNMFKTACSILVHFPSRFLPKRFVSVQMVQPYSSIDTVWKNSGFILSDRSNFPMVDNQSISVYCSPMRITIPLPVDEILLPRNTNQSKNFRGFPFYEEMESSWLKHMKSVLSAVK